MKFMFVDESERNRKKTKNYFLLLGLIVDKENILNLELEINDFKKKHDMKSLKELRSGKFNKDSRLECTHQLMKLLKTNHAKASSIILGPFSIRRKKLQETYLEGLDFLIERFYYGLKRENKIGLIVSDSLPKKTEKNLKLNIRQLIYEREMFMFGKSKGKCCERIHPTPLFIEDEYSNILQMTDLLCTSLQNAVWTYVEKNQDYELLKLKKNEDELINYGEYLHLYWDIIERNSQGKASGWGIKIWH